MGVRIRLARHGRIHSPFYRLVACDSRSPRNGRHLEILGTYNPLPSKVDNTKELRLNVDRVKYWLGVGAQGTPPVEKLLGRFGIMPAGAGDYRSVETAVPKKDRKTGRGGVARKFSTAAEKAGEENVEEGAAAGAESMLARVFGAGMAPWAVLQPAFWRR